MVAQSLLVAQSFMVARLIYAPARGRNYPAARIKPPACPTPADTTKNTHSAFAFSFLITLKYCAILLDIDECKENPCGDGALCTNLPGKRYRSHLHITTSLTPHFAHDSRRIRMLLSERLPRSPDGRAGLRGHRRVRRDREAAVRQPGQLCEHARYVFDSTTEIIHREWLCKCRELHNISHLLILFMSGGYFCQCPAGFTGRLLSNINARLISAAARPRLALIPSSTLTLLP